MSAIAAEFEQFKQSLIDKGIDMGIDKGIDRGVLKGQAQSVLSVLEARGIAAPESARVRILSCADPALLKRWLLSALHVSSAEELFAT